MRKRRTIVVTAGVGSLAAALVTAAATVAPMASATTAGHTATAGAQIRIKPGVHALRKATAQPPTTTQCESQLGIACYGPTQIQAAYNEGPLFRNGITGKGKTIVIVDAFGSPTIKTDLKTFDKQYGIPNAPSVKVIAPAGKIPAWDPGNADMAGWAGETTLDVEYAHTVAPGASIVLVETPVAETEGVTGFPQIVKAENYVVSHHLGDVISQSFGATEQTFTSYKQLAPLRSAYKNAYAHGVTVLAAAGDDGASGGELNGTDLYTKAVTEWPATDPLVTAVGGTQLVESFNGSFTSVTWNDTYSKTVQQAFFGTNGPNALATGGGVSEFFRRPWYQDGVANVTGPTRGIPDISMNAACNGVVNVYQSFPGQPAGWYLVCGTSEATPLFSGIVALADQVAHHKLGLVNPALYELYQEHADGLDDVMVGNNTVGFSQDGKSYTVKGYSAKKGYDLVTGVGTVNASALVPDLAAASQW